MKSLQMLSLYSGVVYDTMKYDMKYDFNFVVNLKPLKPLTHPIFGNVYTIKGEQVNGGKIKEQIRINVFDTIPSGSIAVYQTGGGDVAHFGDITSIVMKQRGVAGVVMNGYTRDSNMVQLPMFCLGTRPEDAYGYWQISDSNIPITLNGVSVLPDSFIFADNDGVLVIPNKDVDKVIKLALKRMGKEETMRKMLLGGVTAKEVYKKVGRW